MSKLVEVLLGAQPLAALVGGLLRINLVVSVVVVAVFFLRAPLRRFHGPAMAYRLWWAPVIAAGMTAVVTWLSPIPDTFATFLASRPHLLRDLLWAWTSGAVAMAGGFAFAQARFHVQLKSGRPGPAVVGFIAPRIVFPEDGGGFNEAEQVLIRAHEREHVRRKDPRGVAAITLVQCLCWFNPLAHLASSLLRLDQELACDAGVILRRPGSRALYARTLLKGQLMTGSPPLGCCWMALGVHPLELRIAQLKRPGPASPQSAVHAMGDAILP